MFLAPDGVINSGRSDFVESWEEFEFLPSLLEALAATLRSSHKIAVVTNQSGDFRKKSSQVRNGPGFGFRYGKYGARRLERSRSFIRMALPLEWSG